MNSWYSILALVALFIKRILISTYSLMYIIHTHHPNHVLNVEINKKNINITCEIIDVKYTKCILTKVWKQFSMLIKSFFKVEYSATIYQIRASNVPNHLSNNILAIKIT